MHGITDVYNKMVQISEMTKYVTNSISVVKYFVNWEIMVQFRLLKLYSLNKDYLFDMLFL